ncbi:lipid-A-disaccharide synthase [Pelobacter propionicus]|uniref:Lipid-A-disaccharide synthase n=1 Tax=Pelobacter propionicus (strain DSM 2379 / NBRC 103807 / OttBd1) TaxID=338966 RepID=A1ATF1_PELPD|nr:lipid-A-disaccharide synthase [Pelobacter propionicus]ABL00622.1 lipid-A-disaccharide synthase [Pelobacter propionicus DSM 2379]
MSERRVMIVAGEASGDIYGAQLASETARLSPNIRFFGIGGERMREAGVQTLVDSADMAVVGLVEVLRHFDVIAKAFLKLKRILLQTPPHLLVLIDYPGFNLRLARVARRSGVRVLYYISPQIWAWRQGRVHEIARLVDHMAVIFPFELPFYRNAGVAASFVGHPLYDLVAVEASRDQAAASFGLDPSRRILGLFPGSRRSEVQRLLPVIVQAAALLKQCYPDLQLVLPLASTLGSEDIAPHLPSDLPVTITRDRIHDLIRGCDAIISVSGTVTLEIALLGTPMVVIYKLSPLTYQLARRLVKVDNIALCNIVAGETVVRELIQDDASANGIAAEIGTILDDDAYAGTIRAKLATVRSRLGRGGAARNVARLILEMVEQS